LPARNDDENGSDDDEEYAQDTRLLSARQRNTPTTQRTPDNHKPRNASAQPASDAH